MLRVHPLDDQHEFRAKYNNWTDKHEPFPFQIKTQLFSESKYLLDQW